MYHKLCECMDEPGHRVNYVVILFSWTFYVYLIFISLLLCYTVCITPESHL